MPESIIEQFNNLRARIEADKTKITAAELERLRSTLQLLGQPAAMGKVAFRTVHRFVHDEIIANDFAIIRNMLGEPCKGTSHGVIVNITANGAHITVSLSLEA
jgi:hypothetical protein